MDQASRDRETPSPEGTPKRSRVPADLPPHLAALLDDITRRRRALENSLPTRRRARADGLEPVTAMLVLVVIAASCLGLYVGLSILAHGDDFLLTRAASGDHGSVATRPAVLASLDRGALEWG